MSLISPNFAVNLSFFPILARGLFPKLLEKALNWNHAAVLAEKQKWFLPYSFIQQDNGLAFKYNKKQEIYLWADT